MFIAARIEMSFYEYFVNKTTIFAMKLYTQEKLHHRTFSSTK